MKIPDNNDFHRKGSQLVEYTYRQFLLTVIYDVEHSRVSADQSGHDVARFDIPMHESHFMDLFDGVETEHCNAQRGSLCQSPLGLESKLHQVMTAQGHHDEAETGFLEQTLLTQE